MTCTTTPTQETLTHYETHATTYGARYEAIQREDLDALYTLYTRWIPAGAQVLELGCGSGRDARFLATLGARVVACDGAQKMVNLARQYAQEAELTTSQVRFQKLALPPPEAWLAAPQTALDALDTPQGFDAVVAIGVLQHLDEASLLTTTQWIQSVLRPSGTLILSVPIEHPEARDTIKPNTRHYYDHPISLYTAALEKVGLTPAYISKPTRQGPPQTPALWVTAVYIFDQTSKIANTSLTGIIDNDHKTSSYKFALLNALCHINITRPNCAHFFRLSELAHIRRHKPKALFFNDELIGLPLFYVVEAFIEMYWRLCLFSFKKRPQAPAATILAHAPKQFKTNQKLSFGQALIELMRVYQGDYWRLKRDLYTGQWRGQGPGDTPDPIALTRFVALLTQVKDTLIKGPIYYAGNSLSTALTGTSDQKFNRVFDTLSTGASLKGRHTVPDFVAAMGQLCLSANLWRQLHFIAPWLRDSIVLSWAQFCAANDATHDLSAVLSPLTRNDDVRTTELASRLYQRTSCAQPLTCVWTQRPLGEKTLHIDHVIPWVQSRNNDLWNLLPTHRQCNLSKSDALPTNALLYEAKPRIVHYWEVAAHAQTALFFSQAQAAFALPESTFSGSRPWQEPLFQALVTHINTLAHQFHIRRWQPSN